MFPRMCDRIAGWTVLRAVDGIVQQNGMWDYPPLGISIPAPPLLLTPDSCPEAFVRAREAVDLGLASARRSGRCNLLGKLLRTDALPATESIGVPSGKGPSQARVLVMMLRSLGWPFVLTAAVWCGMEVAGLRVLALLCSLVFFVLVSLILHELGHILVFRFYAPATPALFTVRAGRFRFIRCSLPRHQDLTVTIAGPIGAFFLPALLVPLHHWIPIPFWTSMVVAVSHLALLLRNDGDGQMLREALRQGPLDRSVANTRIS